MSKKVYAILGIVIGGLSLIFAIFMFSTGVGYYISPEKFGADYYTYSHEAMARTAWNVANLSEILKTGFGCAFLLFGSSKIVKGIASLTTPICINEQKDDIKDIEDNLPKF